MISGVNARCPDSPASILYINIMLLCVCHVYEHDNKQIYAEISSRRMDSKQMVAKMTLIRHCGVTRIYVGNLDRDAPPDKEESFSVFRVNTPSNPPYGLPWTRD